MPLEAEIETKRFVWTIKTRLN